MANKTNRMILGADGRGEGNFTSMQHNIDFLFDTNPDHKQGDENSPSHRVLLRSPAGGAFDAGAAWRKKVGPGKTNSGAIFYSIAIDDPSFSTPLNLTAFCVATGKSKDDISEWEIVWRRPVARSAV